MSYQSTVLADSPSFYYEMNETSGATLADSTSNGYTANVLGGVTLAQAASPTGSNSVLLDGSSGYIQNVTHSISSPDTYSVELWFKTSTTSGGFLADFWYAGNDDRNMYMDNNGHINAGIWNGTANSVTTEPNPYNDGKWHHMVVTLSGMTLTIYIDGVQQISQTFSGSLANYSGQWNFGYLGIDTWSNMPTSRYFQGYISDIAVWDGAALTSTQVSNHYNAATGGTPSPATGTVSATGTSTATMSGTPVIVGSVSASGESSTSISGTPVVIGPITAQGTSSATVSGSPVSNVTISAQGTSTAMISGTPIVVGVISAQGTSVATVRPKASIVIQSITIYGTLSGSVTLQGTQNRSQALTGTLNTTTTLTGTKSSTITLGGEI